MIPLAKLIPPVSVRTRLAQLTVFPGGDATPKPMRVVAKARWGKDPNTILTGSTDGFLRVFDVRTGEKARKVRSLEAPTLQGKSGGRRREYSIGLSGPPFPENGWMA